MPFQHIVRRLSEGQRAVFRVTITGRCTWPYCPAQALSLGLMVDPRRPVARENDPLCPVCTRPVKILSAVREGS
jgi:hypothetical protein